MFAERSARLSEAHPSNMEASDTPALDWAIPPISAVSRRVQPANRYDRSVAFFQVASPASVMRPTLPGSALYPT